MERSGAARLPFIVFAGRYAPSERARYSKSGGVTRSIQLA